MDNYFQTCPPKMSDGRLFTDYRTAVRREEYIKYVNKILRDDDYRMFLQQGAEKIMDNEWKFLKQNNSCFVNECVHNYPTRVIPEMFNQEKRNYDMLANKSRNIKFECKNMNDYRLNK